MTEKISFLASFPPIQSAIKIGDTGMRITLDIPESELPKAIKIITLREAVIQVTVNVAKNGSGLPNKATIETSKDSGKHHDV